MYGAALRRSWQRHRCRGPRALGVQGSKRGVQLARLPRAHHARDFPPFAQENEGGPELDAKRASERFTLAVFDPLMSHIRMLSQRAVDQGARRLANRAPARAELEHGVAGKSIDIRACG